MLDFLVVEFMFLIRYVYVIQCILNYIKLKQLATI